MAQVQGGASDARRSNAGGFKGAENRRSFEDYPPAADPCPHRALGVVRYYSKGGLMGLLGPLILRLEVPGGGTRVEAWPHGVKICRGGLDAERGL